MKKYFDIFIKSVIAAAGITAVTVICFTVQTLLTYSVVLNSIEKRITNIESYILNQK